ncbi:MAG: YicC/YloC family endoribonuclease [Lysobacterales bacterium]
MLHSMTAFASAEIATSAGALSCEIRSVNHRYLELQLRLPDELRAIESTLRERVAARIARGKVDLTMRLRPHAGGPPSLDIDEALLERVLERAKAIASRVPHASVDPLALLAWPGVVREPERDGAALHAAALTLVSRALDDFAATRAREGERLQGFITERLDAIAALIAQLRVWLPDIRAALRLKLETRLADLKLPLDPGRFEQELVLGLSKLDVDEELDRLQAHIAEARGTLARGEAAGRRLDFLLQEFNREANTLGSKSVDARTSQASVELKVLIEQVREQVQNIE